MKLLSRSEELILLAVWKLQDEAYGVSIRKYIAHVTAQSWSIGAIYVPLDKLCKHRYITAHMAPPTSERGGRSKRYFKLTARGLSALNEVRRIENEMWADLPIIAEGSIVI